MPDYVVKMFEAARTDPTGKRARETEIMNQAFTKTGKHMVLDLAKPPTPETQTREPKGHKARRRNPRVPKGFKARRRNPREPKCPKA